MQRGALQKLLDALIILLVVVVLGLTGWVMTRDVAPSVTPAEETAVDPPATAEPSTTTTPSAPQSSEPGPTTFAVVGDGYAADPGWPALVSSQTGLTLTADEAAAGSGYVGAAGSTFLDQVEQLVDGAEAPDVVIVAGSPADAAAPGADVRDAARAVYDLLADQLPETQVVVIGPMWPAGSPPAGNPNAARQGVKAVARGAGLIYVDPQKDEWLGSAGDDLVTADGAALTDAGQAAVADRVEQLLRAEGVLGATG